MSKKLGQSSSISRKINPKLRATSYIIFQPDLFRVLPATKSTPLFSSLESPRGSKYFKGKVTPSSFSKDLHASNDAVSSLMIVPFSATEIQLSFLPPLPTKKKHLTPKNKKAASLGGFPRLFGFPSHRCLSASDCSGGRYQAQGRTGGRSQAVAARAARLSATAETELRDRRLSAEKAKGWGREVDLKVNMHFFKDWKFMSSKIPNCNFKAVKWDAPSETVAILKTVFVNFWKSEGSIPNRNTPVLSLE